MINQEWLNTFVSLVNIGHFTQTARKLNMTQPGVSQHIKKLEDQLGLPLLERHGKKFELTRVGGIVYSFGNERKKSEEMLFHELQDDSPYKGICKIACSGAMALYLYPHFIEQQKKHTELIFQIEAAPNHLILSHILNNKIDMGIVTKITQNEILDFNYIGDETLCLIIPESYSKSKIPFELLESIGLINHPDCFHYVDKVFSSNFTEQFEGVEKIKVSGSVNQINQILFPVASGLGFTVLPHTAVEQFMYKEKIYVVPLKNQIKNKIYIVTKKHRQLPVRYDWTQKTIEKLIKKI